MSRLTIGLVLVLLATGCAKIETPRQPVLDPSWEPPAQLSAYGLFLGNGTAQEPAPGVFPYDINTPLFSDYAVKFRFIALPAGEAAIYHDPEVFDFPAGTIIAKTFSYPFDMRDPAQGRRLMETRLLIHRPDGWIGLPYVWDEQQTEATLKIAGTTRDVQWVDTEGNERKLNYIIPNVNQCLGCHENNRIMRPIGPKARNLNRDYQYRDGKENQLARWMREGHLQGAPELAQAPKLAVWNDSTTGSLQERARAYLEMNCAHCHNPVGPARTSGLDLRYEQTNLAKVGFRKTPIAAGRGSGGRLFDVVPGKPDDSILVYRISSAEPGVMMPELGRRLVDPAGVALIREWIASLQ
jgi:uncharacterized repeat protein (TIGR03806 family)